MRKSMVMATLAAGVLFATAANATQVVSASDPALSGGTVVDFESTPAGTGTPLTVGNVTFGGSGWSVDNDWIGQYNSRGINHLANGQSRSPRLTFTFAKPVSSLGFLWGASDSSWTLRAYGSDNNLLESFTLPVTGSSNDGEFYGLSDAGIASATLTTDGYGDWVFVDNFTYAGDGSASVPEPSTLLLLGAGLAGVGFLRRRKAA